MRAGTGVLVAAAALSLGAVGALAAVGVLTGEDAEATAEIWLPIELTEFADARGVSASMEVPEAAVLTIPTSGRLTESTCEHGASVASGTTVARVDGTAVVALSTATPLWRDLAPGSRGTDVTALQEELNRLGESLEADGRYGNATAAAVNRLWDRAGAGNPEGRLRLAHTLWLPAPEVRIGTCERLLGETVDPSSAFARLAVAPTAVRITSLPSNPTPGDRVVSFGGVSVPYEPVITDPAMIAAAQASDSYTLWTIDPTLSDLSLTVDYALAQPLQVAVVPPAAVGGRTGAFCVEGRTGPVPVEVVGSQLGQSYLTSTSDLPAEVRLPPPGGEINCG